MSFVFRIKQLASLLDNNFKQLHKIKAMRKNISSLEELEAEQQKLNNRMAITHQEFALSLERSQTKLKSFLLKKVAIPAGAIGLGAVAAKQVLGSNNEDTKDTNHPKSAHLKSAKLLGLLLPLGLSFLQTYVLKK